MKIPKKLILKKTDSKELQEVKQTLNDLLEFYYQFHEHRSDFLPVKQPQKFIKSVKALVVGGGGC